MNATDKIVTEADLTAAIERARPLHLKHAAAHGLVVLEIAERHGVFPLSPFTTPEEVRECFLRSALPESDPEFGGWFERLGQGTPRTIRLDLIYSIGMALTGLRPDVIDLFDGRYSDKAVRDAVSLDLYGEINWSVEGRLAAVMKAVEEYTVRALEALTEEQRVAMGWGQ